MSCLYLFKSDRLCALSLALSLSLSSSHFISVLRDAYTGQDQKQDYILDKFSCFCLQIVNSVFSLINFRWCLILNTQASKKWSTASDYRKDVRLDMLYKSHCGNPPSSTRVVSRHNSLGLLILVILVAKLKSLPD